MIPTDLIKNKSDEEAVKQGYTYDETLPLKVKKFLETYCIQSKAPWTGKPLKLLDWQWSSIIRPIYGWKKPDGSRRFTQGIIFIPKKCGKTTLLSGLSLYHLLEQAGSEVYCIASDIQQAEVLYSQSADMVELSPQLQKRLWVRRNIKQIEDQKKKSKFRVLSSTPEGKSGFNANLICYDEIAEWNGTHARTIWDRLINAGMARKDPLQLVISTANYTDPSHLGYQLFQKAERIATGKEIDLTTLPVLYCLDQNEDWQIKENWKKVCPSWGITVEPSVYDAEFEKAKANPLDARRFRTFLLCQWISAAPNVWIPHNDWMTCYEEFREEDLYGLPAVIGIDMARRNDLASYVLLIEKDGKYYILPRYFMPEMNALKKEETDRVPYTVWSGQNLVTLTNGDVIDPAAIRRGIKEDAEHFAIDEIRFDPYGMEETRQILEEEGFNMVEVKQAFNVLSNPTNAFEKYVLEKKIRHNDNPILNWNLQNTVIKVNNDDKIMIDKRRSTGRIDGITASILALSAQMVKEDVWDIPLCGIL